MPSSSLLTHFGAAYLLNLEDRPDRLAAARAQTQALDPTARVIVYTTTRPRQAHGFPSAGAYGCFQGHLGILREARDRSLPSVLILEDDIAFTPAAATLWPQVATALASTPWALLNLGFDAHHLRTLEGPQPKTDSPLLPICVPLMLAHCYAVHGAILPQLVASLEAILTRPPGDPRGGPMHFDGALHHFCADHPDLLRLRPRLSLAGQRSSRSDIAQTRWFDRHLPALANSLRTLKTNLSGSQK